MRRTAPRLSSFKVGAIVLAVLTVVVYFAWTKSNPLANPYKVEAVFDSALSVGIRANSPVRVAGVNVGKVKDVRRGPGTTVIADLEISKAGLPIHTDTTIKARPRLFLEGNYFLELRPGTPSSPVLSDGGTIPLSQTAIPVQLDEVLDTFESDTRRSFQNLLGGLSTALKDDGARALRANLRRAPGALKATSTALEAAGGTDDGDLAGVIRDQARLNSALDDNRVELQGLLTGFRVTMDALAAKQAALADTIPALSGLLKSAPAATAALDRALPPLRALSVALRPGLRVAPRTLDEAVPFVAALDSLTRPSRLGALVPALRPAVSGLVALEKSLPPLLDVVKPVSQCITTRVLPVLNDTVPDGALSTHTPVWKEAFSLGTGLLSSQQNFGGDGYSTRYSFGIDTAAIATKLPGPGNLVQLTDEPMLGSRPAFANKQPPLVSDEPCIDQPLTTLTAQTAAAPSRQTRIKVPRESPKTPKQFEALARLLQKSLQRDAR